MVYCLIAVLALCLASSASACEPASCSYPVWQEENCDARDPTLCMEGMVGLHVRVHNMAHVECPQGTHWQQNFEITVLDIIRNDVDFMPIHTGMKLTASTGYGMDVGCGFSCSTEVMEDNKEYIVYANAIDPDTAPIWPVCGNDADLYVGYCFHSMADPTEDEIQLAKDTCLAQSTSKHFQAAAGSLKALALPSIAAVAAVVLLML